VILFVANVNHVKDIWKPEGLGVKSANKIY